MGLAGALDDVLTTFRLLTLPDGSSLRAFADSSTVNPPCVWVPVPDITFMFGKGVLDVTWLAYLLAPNQSTASVTPSLSALVDAVAGLFPFTDGTAQPLTLPGGGQSVPSYRLTWHARIPIGA